MTIKSAFKFTAGVFLTLFNICVFLFTQGSISPKYFETLFAIYFLIGLIVGIRLMWENRFCLREVSK